MGKLGQRYHMLQATGLVIAFLGIFYGIYLYASDRDVSLEMVFGAVVLVTLGLALFSVAFSLRNVKIDEKEITGART